jgi:hypothetical protein
MRVAENARGKSVHSGTEYIFPGLLKMILNNTYRNTLNLNVKGKDPIDKSDRDCLSTLLTLQGRYRLWTARTGKSI